MAAKGLFETAQSIHTSSGAKLTLLVYYILLVEITVETTSLRQLKTKQ